MRLRRAKRIHLHNIASIFRLWLFDIAYALHNPANLSLKICKAVIKVVDLIICRLDVTGLINIGKTVKII